MLTDDDMSAIQVDFGVLAAKSPMTCKRGTESAKTHVIGAPYTTRYSHYCTVLTLSQVKDAYLTSFSQKLVQSTKNPRVLLIPLPIPGGDDVLRGDFIEVNGEDFQVLDLDNNSTYQFQRVAFAQYVEGSTV